MIVQVFLNTAGQLSWTAPEDCRITRVELATGASSLSTDTADTGLITTDIPDGFVDRMYFSSDYQYPWTGDYPVPKGTTLIFASTGALEGRVTIEPNLS
jgi:hypothetical protein